MQSAHHTFLLKIIFFGSWSYPQFTSQHFCTLCHPTTNFCMCYYSPVYWVPKHPCTTQISKNFDVSFTDKVIVTWFCVLCQDIVASGGFDKSISASMVQSANCNYTSAQVQSYTAKLRVYRWHLFRRTYRFNCFNIQVISILWQMHTKWGIQLIHFVNIRGTVEATVLLSHLCWCGTVSHRGDEAGWWTHVRLRGLVSRHLPHRVSQGGIPPRHILSIMYLNLVAFLSINLGYAVRLGGLRFMFPNSLLILVLPSAQC